VVAFAQLRIDVVNIYGRFHGVL